MELKKLKPLVLSLLTAGVARFFTHRNALSILGDIDQMEKKQRSRQKRQIPVFGKHSKRVETRRKSVQINRAHQQEHAGAIMDKKSRGPHHRSFSTNTAISKTAFSKNTKSSHWLGQIRIQRYRNAAYSVLFRSPSLFLYPIHWISKVESPL